MAQKAFPFLNKKTWDIVPIGAKELRLLSFFKKAIKSGKESNWGCFLKKAVLKNSQENTCVGVSF